MTSWCSLYLPCDAKPVIDSLTAALAALGYQAFNPFGLIPGKSYPQAVRLFVAPARQTWTRVIGTPDPALLPPLSLIAPCLWLELDGSDAHITAYQNGAEVAPEAAFTLDPACLDQPVAPTEAGGQIGGVPLDALPDDVQALAQTIDLRQAGKLFDKMNASVAQKVSGDSGDLLRQPDWNSAGGRRLRAWLTCLGLDQQPDFVTLRDAYALHERRRRSPNATLYPGDAELLAAVPDALTYTPVYAGKSP